MRHRMMFVSLLPVLSMPFHRIAAGQCELHEDAKLTASDDAPGASFGSDVLLIGDELLVGAVRDDCTAGDECGSVYVYRFEDSVWVEKAKLTASDADAGDHFSAYLSRSGDVVMVGAPLSDCAEETHDCGSVYVYNLDGTSWVEGPKLVPNDLAGGDRFGAVSVSGDWAIVGAYVDNCPAGTECGSAYVFHFDGAVWLQTQKLTSPDANQHEYFGYAVSLSGDTAVVTAVQDDCTAGLMCGAAHVFHRVGDSWMHEAKLTASDGMPVDWFGHSVFLSADLAIVGAYLDACVDETAECGAAYVFRRSGSTWAQEAKLTASDAAAYDQFGNSVSLSGDTAVVGSLGDDCLAGGECGSAYVFRHEGTGWVQKAKLTASDPVAFDLFGYFVSVSDDIVAIGARFDDCTAGDDCGSVYIFDLTLTDCDNNGIPDECDIANCSGDPACGDCNNNGVPDICEFDIVAEQIAKLTASDGSPGDNFGTSVSVDGDTAVVGAVGDDIAAYTGSAHVFSWNGSSWFEEQELLASDGAADDGFGYSVSVRGDIALVGAMRDDDSGSASGSAYVFRWNGSVWVEEQKLLASDGAAGDWFGSSVSVSGDVAVVGAWLDDDNGSASGSAYVFRWNGASWAQEQKLFPSDGAAGDYFGWSVSVWGDVVVVGARYGDGNETDSGSAYVFHWNGSAWVQVQELLASDGAENDEFGISVSISVSGDTAVVGAWHNDDAGLHSGSAYVFTRSGTTWTEQQNLIASDAAAIDYFGVSVSLSNNVAVVGAHFDDDNGSASGSAYVFRYHPELLIGNRWVEEHKLLASDGAVFDNFGVSVSVSGDMAVIGSRYDDDNGSDSGSAYFFKIGIVDCNANGIPDECDIADCPPNTPACSDCNSNSVPDSCDIANCAGDPACGDCNNNGVPDTCDIASCPACTPACVDCNDNGVPDACDIASGYSQDLNLVDGQPIGNGIPDECETCPADLNCDGVVNPFDLALLLGNWGACPCEVLICPQAPDADVNGDCIVNPFDLALLLGAWGPCQIVCLDPRVDPVELNCSGTIACEDAGGGVFIVDAFECFCLAGATEEECCQALMQELEQECDFPGGSIVPGSLFCGCQ